MKKIIWILALFPLSVSAMSDRVQLDRLNAQIEILERQRTEKYDELKQCEKTTKGFKIAAISTLAATGVGIYANIALHKKLSKLRNDVAGGGKLTQSINISNADECKNMCEDDPIIFEEDCHCSTL